MKVVERSMGWFTPGVVVCVVACVVTCVVACVVVAGVIVGWIRRVDIEDEKGSI